MATKEKLRDLRFKKRIAPSRHSGLSSLSPKEPNNSLTIMSAGSGKERDRMSPKSRGTFSFHSEAFRRCRLWDSVTGARHPDPLITSMANSRYISARVLLDSVDERVTLDTRNCVQTSCNERAPPGSRHADDSGGMSTLSYVCTKVFLHLICQAPFRQSRVYCLEQIWASELF